MTELFDRVCSVTVGPKNGDGRLLEGLRVQFKIEKSLSKNPNQATIEVTNLSKETRALIETVPVRGASPPAVILVAGYQARASTLYRGDIAKVTTRRQSGTDIQTTIECGDGEFPFRNARLDLSFRPGTTFQTVLDRLSAEYGVSLGPVKGLQGSEQFLGGLSLSGLVRDHLTKILARQGLTWSVQDDVLQILPEDQSTDQSAVFLSPATGLVSSPYTERVIRPERVKSSVGGVKGQPARSGVKLLSLLNPELRPGRRVQVDAENVKGVFRIEKVTHTGDTHGTPWYSEVEAV